jgi:hypothetical protein
MSITIKQFVIGPAASATAAGDVAASAGVLRFDLADTNVTGVVPVNLRSYPLVLAAVTGGMYQAGAAEVLRIITLAPTAANSTDYRVVLSTEKGQVSNNNLPSEVQSVFIHTTAASGGTAASISTAIVNAINAHPFWNTRVVATSPSSNIVITARAGFPIFSVGVGPLISNTVSTAGSPSVGIGATLIASGTFPTVDDGNGIPVSGQTYNVISYDYEVESRAAMGGAIREKHIIYVNSNGNNSTLLSLLQPLLSTRF